MSVYNIDGDVINSLYDVSGSLLNNSYDLNGNIVYTKGMPIIDYDDYTMTPLYSISVQNCQGIAVYNDVLFQFRASGTSITDKVCLFDFTDGSDILRNMTIKSDHGDSATFSKEFYANSDEFPLLYVTADTSPAKVYINRITRSASTLIKTLSFPQSAGYYGASAFDWDNDICYLLSYKQNNYLSDNSGANTTVISKWDLSDLTDNGDGTYTPAFISQYERDFIYCMQGLAFHDGMIWIASGYTNSSQYVYAMNPNNGEILHTILFNDTIEIEGVQFIYDNNAQSYYLVTGQQGGIYKKYIFATQ